ncbi:MAG TPA: AAA family ATPase, partial [Bacteroidales bacterium]|nr:AAA family ATPase [Bacteroidales bacterium]
MDNCLGANRPLIFTVVENDVELLKYIKDTYKKDEWQVFSSTFARLVPLHQLLNSNFVLKDGRAIADNEVLNNILNRHFDPNSNQFVKIIFLEADMILGDKQNIRKIKDILSRYQLDEDFTVSLIFVSQVVFVPQQLERLGELVFFDLPNEEKIQEISEKVIKKLELKSDQRPSPEVVNNLKGLTAYEIEQSYLQSYHLYQKVELNFIRDFKKNSIAKTDLLSLMETDVTFNDIGGMEKLKKWIQKSYGGWTIEGKKFGLPLLKGVLLVGLPGCGKSLIMKAIGNEWGLPVVSFDPSRIFSSRVGDSESNMRRVLNIVENMSPCLLVIDEIEKGLAGMQSSTFSDSGVTARVIGSFLIWMQDCTKPVFIVATA